MVVKERINRVGNVVCDLEGISIQIDGKSTLYLSQQNGNTKFVPVFVTA